MLKRILENVTGRDSKNRLNIHFHPKVDRISTKILHFKETFL